jgi:hypothetical protein
MTGAQFERYVAQVFHDNGHHAAVTKISGDHGVDLVLNGYIAVQVKYYSAPVGQGAVQEVVAGKAMYDCTEAWVVTNSSFTPAAVRLAGVNGVRLVAGDELQWLADNPDPSTDHRDRYEAAMAAQRTERRAEISARLAKRDAELQERVAANQEAARVEAERRAAAAAIRRDEEAASDAAFRAQFRPKQPGWYPDPAFPSAQRAYWDGKVWLPPGQEPVPETTSKLEDFVVGALVLLIPLLILAGVGAVLYWLF